MSSFGVLLLRFTTDEERGADSAALQLSDTTVSALTTGFAGVLVAAAVRGSIAYGTAFTVLDLSMCALALIGVLTAGRLRGGGTAVAQDRPDRPERRRSRSSATVTPRLRRLISDAISGSRRHHTDAPRGHSGRHGAMGELGNASSLARRRPPRPAQG